MVVVLRAVVVRVDIEQTQHTCCRLGPAIASPWVWVEMVVTGPLGHRDQIQYSERSPQPVVATVRHWIHRPGRVDLAAAVHV